jgi:hypothetical protein
MFVGIRRVARVLEVGKVVRGRDRGGTAIVHGLAGLVARACENRGEEEAESKESVHWNLVGEMVAPGARPLVVGTKRPVFFVTPWR